MMGERSIVLGICGLVSACGFALPTLGATFEETPTYQAPQDSRRKAVTPAGPVLLQRKPAAPFNASGSMTFLSGFESGRPAIVSLQLRGFSPGRYQLGIVTTSAPTFISLATFSITDPTAGPDRDTSQNTKATANAHQSEQLVVNSVVTLAKVTNTNEIAEFVLADQWGNSLMVGDFRSSPQPQTVSH